MKRDVVVTFDDCPECGAAPVITTDCKVDGHFYDGDEVRCSDCGCPGYFSADEDGGVISWHQEADCDCEWCKAHPVGWND
jgi:hypothetical protein